MGARMFSEVLAARMGGSLLKADRQHRVVFAVVLESGVADRQGDVIEDADLLETALAAGLGAVEAGVQHQRVTGIGKMVASFPLTLDVAEALGIVLPNGRGLWLIGLKITDDSVWADVEAGRFSGVSIGGKGRRESV